MWGYSKENALLLSNLAHLGICWLSAWDHVCPGDLRLLEGDVFQQGGLPLLRALLLSLLPLPHILSPTRLVFLFFITHNLFLCCCIPNCSRVECPCTFLSIFTHKCNQPFNSPRKISQPGSKNRIWSCPICLRITFRSKFIALLPVVLIKQIQGEVP